MNKELAKTWTTALRSGDYKQATGVLNSPDGFCCLGVLCDVSKAGHWVTVPRYEVQDDQNPEATCEAYICGDGGSDRSDLPEAIQRLVGFDSEEASFGVTSGMPHRDKLPLNDRRYGQVMPLVALNDLHGFTFDQIADVIDWLVATA